jgi:hypothetical protein
MTAENENEVDPTFISRRRLCPDGACVGVIGPDGKCSECGRTAGGELAPDESIATGTDESIATGTDDPVAETAPVPNDDGAFDPNRHLCSDDGCIGILGDDGRCKVCGKPA